MKKWITIIAIICLSSCYSSKNDNKNYYQLPIPEKWIKKNSTPQENHFLWVKQVNISDYLSGNGLVYQCSDVQYIIARNNLWASPLDQQLKNMLIRNLSNQLPGWVVTPISISDDQDALTINVTGFHGRYDGMVIVNGEWILDHQGKVVKRSFHLKLQQHQDGFDDMLKTLAQGWKQEARQIAKEIARLS